MANEASVDQAVADMLQQWDADPEDYAHVQEYVEIFVDAMKRLMHTDVVLQDHPENDWLDSSYLTYQSMGGALRLTAGCRMTREVMLVMAERYSGEPQIAPDDMAIDCIEEFCNVINGQYIVEMSRKVGEMDLDMPHTVENGEPRGENVLQMGVETDFGSFLLYISMDGFVLDNNTPSMW